MKYIAFLILLIPSFLYAQDCKLTIEGNDLMQFDKKSLEVSKTCKEVELILKHTGKAPKNVMGHNWVLVKESDSMQIGPDSMNAGLENDFVLKDDQRVIAYTKIIGGGEETSIKFDISKLDPSEKYIYLCTFPGHYAIMKGDFIIR